MTQRVDALLFFFAFNSADLIMFHMTSGPFAFDHLLLRSTLPKHRWFLLTSRD
jgi:hypothetical protein